VRRIHKTEEWIKCNVCSGTGKDLRHVKSDFEGKIPRNVMEAFLFQGICLACNGKGMQKVIRKETVETVGFLWWVWYSVFGKMGSFDRKV